MSAADWEVDGDGVIRPVVIDDDPALEAQVKAQLAEVLRMELRDTAAGRPWTEGPVLVVTPAGVITNPERLAALAERAKILAENAHAPATRRAYRSDWQRFERWCAEHKLPALPAEPFAVGMYLAGAAEKHPPATLRRWLSAISVIHANEGHHLDIRHPAVRNVLRGACRTKGTAPQRQAAPLTTDRLMRLLETCAKGRLIDLRDRALLLVGFSAALRQSEIVALDAEDITVSARGARIAIRRSKADQEGEGQVVGINRTGTPTCPVAAYEAWLTAAQISEGAVFRRINRHGHVGDRLVPEGVTHVIRARAKSAEFTDPDAYSGHSLRSGFATAAAARNIEERVIMETTRHRSPMMVRRYIREGQLFARNLAAEVGL